MKARDVQAKNMAEEILKHGENIKFTSNSYKPGVDYIEGSYSLLVQHYVTELGGNIVTTLPDVVVRVHPQDEITESHDIYIFDPWEDYGNTR
jgi:hypothetical protein